jgi:hypothetical protein
MLDANDERASAFTLVLARRFVGAWCSGDDLARKRPSVGTPGRDIVVDDERDSFVGARTSRRNPNNPGDDADSNDTTHELR